MATYFEAYKGYLSVATILLFAFACLNSLDDKDLKADIKIFLLDGSIAHRVIKANGLQNDIDETIEKLEYLPVTDSIQIREFLITLTNKVVRKADYVRKDNQVYILLDVFEVAAIKNNLLKIGIFTPPLSGWIERYLSNASDAQALIISAKLDGYQWDKLLKSQDKYTESYQIIQEVIQKGMKEKKSSKN